MADAEDRGLGHDKPKNGPEKGLKYDSDVIIVSKKRRNDRGKGSMRDLKEDRSNVKMRGGEIEDVCTVKSERVVEKEPQRMARI